jgi:GT2 family glycosyltransferase
MSSAENVQNATRLDDVSVVVLSYNRKDELLNNLPELCEASYQTGFELIIVDNASADGSKETLRSLHSRWPNLQLILNDTNTGVAEGRNTGGRVARGTYLLFIDDDTRIQVEDIRCLRDIMARRAEVGVLTPRVFQALTQEPQNDHGEEEREVGNYHGACHMISRRACTMVGEMDPFCSFGGEELDYSIRVRSQGYTVLYTPIVSVYHNSYIRGDEDGRWRRRMWIYNYTRIHFKHFLLPRAVIFSFRYLISHMVTATRAYGLLFSFSLPVHALRGGMDGKKQYVAVPHDVEKFYSSYSLRPDVGNVPLFRKLLTRGLR